MGSNAVIELSASGRFRELFSDCPSERLLVEPMDADHRCNRSGVIYRLYDRACCLPWSMLETLNLPIALLQPLVLGLPHSASPSFGFPPGPGG